jgi:hypothetical protein
MPLLSVVAFGFVYNDEKHAMLRAVSSLWGVTLPCLLTGSPAADPDGGKFRKEKAPTDFPPAQL